VLSLARNDAPGAGFTDAQPGIARVDTRALRAREDDALRKLKDKEASRGKGVGKEGQDVFDALART